MFAPFSSSSSSSKNHLCSRLSRALPLSCLLSSWMTRTKSPFGPCLASKSRRAKKCSCMIGKSAVSPTMERRQNAASRWCWIPMAASSSPTRLRTAWTSSATRSVAAATPAPTRMAPGRWACTLRHSGSRCAPMAARARGACAFSHISHHISARKRQRSLCLSSSPSSEFLTSGHQVFVFDHGMRSLLARRL